MPVGEKIPIPGPMPGLAGAPDARAGPGSRDASGQERPGAQPHDEGPSPGGGGPPGARLAT